MLHGKVTELPSFVAGVKSLGVSQLFFFYNPRGPRQSRLGPCQFYTPGLSSALRASPAGLPAWVAGHGYPAAGQFGLQIAACAALLSAYQ
jgi:hypothetical protein